MSATARIVYGKEEKLRISARMKASSEARRCPACQRGNALIQKKHKDIGKDFFIAPFRVCRWCKYVVPGVATP